MATNIQHWRRLDVGHADKTYEWLRAAVETNLRLDREDANQDGLQASHRQGGGGSNGKWHDAAAATGGKGKGKIKGGKSGISTPGGWKAPSEIPCRFLYIFNKCKKGDCCDFAHRTPTKSEIRELGYVKRNETQDTEGSWKEEPAEPPPANEEEEEEEWNEEDEEEEWQEGDEEEEEEWYEEGEEEWPEGDPQDWEQEQE